MKRWFSILPLALVIIWSIVIPKSSTAATPVDFFRDTINDMTPSKSGIAHDIYFILPANAQQITPSDYILIELPHFSNVTAPNGVTGGFGNPVFSVSGNTAKITNLAMLPGTGLQIYGIYATNPASSSNFNVTLTIAEDSNGTIVRNQSTTQANPAGNNVSVSATVETPMSAINISGFTSPNAFTTLTQGQSVMGTTVADGTGYFSFPLGGLSPGSYIFNVFSTDSDGRTTSQSIISVHLLASTLTNISGILLSPALSVSPGTTMQSGSVTISGTSKPSSQVNLFVESPLRSYTATSNAAGQWSYTIDSTELANYAPGNYRVNANVQDTIGNHSITSPTANFTVLPDGGSNPPPSCDISTGNLNCDYEEDGGGNPDYSKPITNIIDFSILLFHWETDHAVADINADGLVNLIDFSIMMYYFQ